MEGDVTPPMPKDWEAVARVIDERMRELELTQAELASRAHVSLETVRELRHNLRPRRRSPRILAAISEALDWPSDRIAAVLAGGGGDAEEPQSADSELRAELVRLGHEVKDLSERLETVERQLDAR